MRFFAIVCCLVLLSTTARANHIGIFTEQTGGQCAGTPAYPLYTIYVVALPTTAIQSAAFKIDAALPPGITILTTSPLWGICEFAPCNPFDGAVALRGSCSADVWPLYSLTFFNAGAVLNGSCNHLTVTAAAPPYGFWDCTYNRIGPSGNSFSFIPGPGYCGDCALATEPTTWGSVKALYR